MNPVDNNPLKLSKQESIKIAPDGRKYTASEFVLKATNAQGETVEVSANSINDLMVNILQGVPQEQE